MYSTQTFSTWGTPLKTKIPESSITWQERGKEQKRDKKEIKRESAKTGTKFGKKSQEW